jgi:hypothetical protein
MHTTSHVLSATELHEHHRQVLWLRVWLAATGIALIPAFMVGEAGFPASPSRWGVALVVAVNALFCAFETALVYVWLIRDHVQDMYLRVGLAAMAAGAFGFVQVFVLLMALIFWPFWLLAMVLVLVVAAVQLLAGRARSA